MQDTDHQAEDSEEDCSTERKRSWRMSGLQPLHSNPHPAFGGVGVYG